MSSYTINSTELYHKFYGSNPTETFIQPKEITEPEIMYLDGKLDNNEDNNNKKTIGKNTIFENHNENIDLINNLSASLYEIIKKLFYLGDQTDKINSNFISELNNGFIIISTYERQLTLFNEKFKKILKIKFPFPINSIKELENNENNNVINLICCSIYYIYNLSFDLINKEVKIEKTFFSKNIEDEKNKDDKKDDKNKEDKNKDEKNKDDKKIFNYHFILKLKNNKEFLCTNNGVYEGESILNKKENEQNAILFIQYTEAIELTDNLICFKSNQQLFNGENSLTIFDSNTHKIINKIKDYSFSIAPYKLILLTHNEKNKTLICGCSKYSSEQKNGILVVNLDFTNDDNIKTRIKFEETASFDLNCLCYLKDKKEKNKKNEIFLLVGGVDEDYNQGVVKMFKIKINDNEIDIEYLQNLEFDESIEGSIGFIYQLKNGKIIISCDKGNYLFTEPNLEGYEEDFNEDFN